MTNLNFLMAKKKLSIPKLQKKMIEAGLKISIHQLGMKLRNNNLLKFQEIKFLTAFFNESFEDLFSEKK